ncbi:hypothetical protein CJU89_0362 [Yarrowia sp. B02]|nr:hypothetical protein CJU89_0362 [Yarrowia sp. B02]
MFVFSLLFVSSLVAAADCEDSHVKRGMIQCAMRGVDEVRSAPSHPSSSTNDSPKVAGEVNVSPASSAPEEAVNAPAAAHTPAQAPAAQSPAPEVAQSPASQFGGPAQANFASKPTVELGMGVALAMCLLL